MGLTMEIDETRPEPKICPNCGRLNPGERYNCITCGSNLETGECKIEVINCGPNAKDTGEGWGINGNHI